MSRTTGQTGSRENSREAKSVLHGRRQIDAVDRALVRLLNRRMGLSIRVGHLKKICGMPLFDKAREREIFRQAALTNGGPLDRRTLIGFYRWLLAQSRRQTRRALIGTGNRETSRRARRERT
ncbi:MAG: chorismate mutase [Candidatus Acidiferrales bacterium]